MMFHFNIRCLVSPVFSEWSYCRVLDESVTYQARQTGELYVATPTIL
jgi:hypothetical protein